MALVIYDWYDWICLVVIGMAFLASLYVLRVKEGRSPKSHVKQSTDESQRLLLEEDENEDVFIGSGHLRYSQLWCSCWRGLHPAWLLIIRFFSFLTLCGCLTWDLMEWDASIFFYYTEWTFILVIIYFGIGTIISAHGCVVYYLKKAPPASDQFLKADLEGNATAERGSSLQNQFHKHAIQEPAGFLGYLMQTSYQTCAGAVILTDIIFWSVIVPFLSNAHLQVNWLMGSMHTLNALFLLVDASVNSLPFPWFRLAYFVLWSCCYVIFQLVIHACGYTWWPYPFLELSTPLAPFWYFCLAAIHIPCYGIYWLFIKAKNSLFSKLFPHVFVEH